jgi:hypothetical protein
MASGEGFKPQFLVKCSESRGEDTRKLIDVVQIPPRLHTCILLFGFYERFAPSFHWKIVSYKNLILQTTQTVEPRRE